MLKRRFKDVVISSTEDPKRPLQGAILSSHRIHVGGMKMREKDEKFLYSSHGLDWSRNL